MLCDNAFGELSTNAESSSHFETRGRFVLAKI